MTDAEEDATRAEASATTAKEDATGVEGAPADVDQRVLDLLEDGTDADEDVAELFEDDDIDEEEVAELLEAVADEDTDIDDEDDEPSAANDFGFKLGVPLAVVAVAWAFFGPAHLLELGRYEWPIVASVVEPTPTIFAAYVGGLTFSFALIGSMVFPDVTDEEQEAYASDLAVSLLVPTLGAIVLMVVLGYLIPASHYALNGDLTQAGIILLGMVVVAAVALIFRTIAIIAIALVTVPLWVPSFAGAYGGRFIHDLAG